MEATLEKLTTGHDNNTSVRGLGDGSVVTEFGAHRGGNRNNTVCFLRLRSLSDSNQMWTVATEEASDATGNRIHNTSLGWGGITDGYFTFEPGLWTNEAAWKIKCDLKRVKGFAPDETITFREVPLGSVGATNRLGRTLQVNTVSLTLAEVCRQLPATNSMSWSSADSTRMHLVVNGLTNGLHLDLVSARADNGTNLDCVSWSSGGAVRDYFFRNVPTEARTASFTFAVQSGRWVEFTAKPETGPARLLRNH